jgi:hypothetical protein
MAENWRWSSLWAHRSGDDEARALLSAWPAPEPAHWLRHINVLLLRTTEQQNSEAI